MNNFSGFEKFVRAEIHPVFHDCVGGHMQQHQFASFTPELWLRHSYVNKLWADWQMKMESEIFNHYINVAFEMPLSQLFPREPLDNHDLPGEIKTLMSPHITLDCITSCK